MLKLGQPVLHASEEMVDVGFLAVHVVLLFIVMPLLFVSSMLFIPVAPLLVSSVLLLPVTLLFVSSVLFLPVVLFLVPSVLLLPVALFLVSSVLLLPVALFLVSSVLLLLVALFLVSSVLLLLVALLVMLSPLFPVLAGTIGTPHLGSPGSFIATGACLFSGSRSLFSLEFGSSGVVPALSKRWKGKQAHQDKGKKCGIHYCLGHG